ncbi:uncharacterized protein LOC125560703 [Nematostella vectensis]|uniref:uncharacterized protein LOC125560703 n=1 Tax=Nematostella vectensis TaxID=45351 RepID=UPI0020776691|nr:uncharacterized protein LOC125560703 [Nematostella vectensis]
MENPVSRKQAAALKKKEIKRAKDKDYYEKNRNKKIAQVIERRKARREETKGKSRTRTEIKKAASKKRRKEQRATAREELERKRQIAREKTRERVRRYRQKNKEEQGQEKEILQNTGERFKNRKSKKRVTDKAKDKLPQTPEKKAEVLETLINSPRTRKTLSRQGVVKTPEEEKESNTLKALASDISEGLKHVKRSGSNEKRAAYKALKSLAFGDNIKKSRAKKSLGKLVGLNEKSISKAIKTREEILKGEGESWLYVKRKTRRDALPEEDVEKIYCFWASSASRPTGDKSDFVKNRVGKKQYLTHPKHVLETSQTEAFQEFAKLHPEVKVAQRKFEMLKPYFVKQARERDRKSCLCRKHVETKILFDACMKFRKGVVKTTGNESEESPIFKTLTEAADATLCSKEDGIEHHKIECLERDCNRCSVEKIKLLPEESSNEGSVCWSRYEYLPTGKFLANGQEKKKIALVPKETPPSEMFKYFKKLLEAYPLHSFMAKWQREQLDNLLEHLPLGHVVCIHDYSEGYACRQQDEIQSEFFDVTKASLHVTILHRHAVESKDGITSTEAEPHLIKEHLFVVSDDPTQDHDSVHKAQELIHDYLVNDVGYSIELLHEFTDGCAAQYKSRHCIGDLSCSLADFGYPIQRSFFETSHAKGEQDAAGSHVKQKTSQAVLRRKAKINSAKDMYAYLVANFTEPAATSYAARRTATQLTRRVFFYVPAKGEGAVSRNRDGRKFKEAKGIRKWHCVKTLPQQEKVLVRHRTCYCVSCIVKDEDSCTNKAWLDEWKEVTIPRDGSVAITRQATEQPALEHDTASHMADLAACGSTVAIEAEGDRMYDFYLLKVTSAGVEELEHDYTDDYHNTALRGESVLKGHFYLRDNIHDMTFTLNEKRIAVVYAATVRHICGDLPTKKRGKKLIYKLPLKENEAILAIL